MPEFIKDRATWGLAIALFCATFWVVIFDFYRWYF